MKTTLIIMLLVFTSLSRASAVYGQNSWSTGKDLCRLKAEQKEKIEAYAKGMESKIYSIQGYIFPSPHQQTLENRHNFSETTTVGDIMDQRGNIFLFRVIGQRYQKGYLDKGGGYILNQGKSYSYSLSPDIVNSWSNFANDSNPYVLISIQNVMNDNLSYPIFNGSQYPLPSEIMRSPLVAETRTSEIIFYDEVKVPMEKENVVAVMQISDFKQLVIALGAQAFSMKEFVNSIVRSSNIESSECPTGQNAVPNPSKIERDSGILSPQNSTAKPSL